MSSQPSNTCFNCGEQFPEGAYGLTQCPSCSTLVLIDFEGNVQKPPDESEVSEVTPDPPPVKTSDPIVQEESHQPTPPETSEPHPEAPDLDSSLKNETDVMPQTNFDMKDDHHKEPGEGSVMEEPSPVEDKAPPDVSLQHTPPVPNELQDVVDYANSDTEESSSLSYNITISGIDSKELRESVLDALNDSRFGWTQGDIEALIQDGCLHLKKINAAKTYILMTVLKFLPVKVHWDQVSFHSM